MDELGVAARRRITRQLLIGVPVLVTTALLVAKLPAWLVTRADEQSNSCLTDANHRHADPASCTPGLGLSIARMFPPVREHAREIARDVEARQAGIAFDNVMAAHPDPAQRDAAARRLIDGGDRELYRAARAGAFAVVAAVDVAHVADHDEPAFAALAIGDVAGARAKLPHEVPLDHDAAIHSAALACLLGDRTRGLAFLRAAAENMERVISSPDSSARFAAQHCGGTFATLGFDPFAVASYHADDALLSRAFDPKFQAGRRAAVGWAMLFGLDEGSRSLGLAAGSDFEPSPTQLLDLVAGSGTHVSLYAMFSVTPWNAFSAAESDAYVDYEPPAWLERAADRFARAAQVVAPKVVDDNLREPAAGHPREVLRDAAVFAYLHAAGYRLRRGDRSAARTALASARALDSKTLARAPLELAVGDPAAALATLDAWEAARPDDDERAVAAVNRALALEAMGEHAKAHAVAKTLSGRAGEWLVLATAITSGAPLAGVVHGPTKGIDESIPTKLLAAIESKQRVDEIGYLSFEDTAVLPAIMVVVAHAARVAGDNPEVELDRVFSAKMQSRTYALARAEAARWRSDPESAKLWQARAETIEKLFVDDDAVVLAGIAGLW